MTDATLNVGSAAGEIRIETAPALRGLERLQNQLKSLDNVDVGSNLGSQMDAVAQQAERAVSQVKKISDEMQKIGGRLTAAVTLPLAAFGFSAVNAASDVAEATSAVQTVYGDAADGVIANAEAAAEALGLSESAYLQAATGLSAYAGMMSDSTAEQAEFSDSVIGAASDLASFYNTSPEDALGALQAGLRGEGDALERYGIILNQANVEQYALENGLISAGEEMDNSTLIAARYGYIMDNLGDAQGDFARTSEGSANQQRILAAEFANLRAELGEKLLPIFAKGIEIARRVVASFSGMSDQMQTVTLAVAGVAAAIGPALAGIGSALPAIVKGFQVARVALIAFTGPVGLIIAALAALGLAYRANLFGFGDAVRGVVSAVTDALPGVISAIQGFINYIRNAFSGDADPLNDWLTRIPGPLRGVAQTIFGVITTVRESIDRLINGFQLFRTLGSNPLQAALGALAVAFPALAGPIERVIDIFRTISGVLGPVIDDIGGIIESVALRFQVVSAASGIVAGVIAALTLGLKRFGDLFRDVGEQAGAFITSLGKRFPKFARTFAAIGDQVERFGELFADVFDLVGRLVNGDFSGAMDKLGEIVGDAFGLIAGNLRIIGSLIADAFRAIDWGAVGRVLGIGLAAAFSALRAGASNLWDWLTDGLAAVDWSALIASVRSALDGVWEGIQSGLQLAWDAITSIDWGRFISAIDWAGLLNRAGDLASSLLGWLREAVGSVDWMALLDTAGDIAGKISGWVQTAIGAVNWGALLDAAGTIASSAVGWVQSAIGSVNWGALLDAAGTIAASAASWIQNAIGSINWGALLDAAGTIASSAVGWIQSAIGSIDWTALLDGAGQIAADIAGWVQSAIGSVNWGAMLDAAGTVARDTATWVLTAIGSVDWKALLDAAGSIARDAATWVVTAIGSVDWGAMLDATGTIARDMIAWVLSALGSVDWKALLAGTADLAQTVIQAIQDAIPDIPWPSREDILNALVPGDPFGDDDKPYAEPGDPDYIPPPPPGGFGGGGSERFAPSFTFPALSGAFGTSIKAASGTLLGLQTDVEKIGGKLSALATSATETTATVKTATAGITTAFGTMRSTSETSIQGFASTATRTTGRMATDVTGAADRTKGGVIRALSDMAAQAINQANRMVQTIISTIRSAAGAIEGAAHYVGSMASIGVANGMWDYLGRVTEAVNAIVREVDRGLRKGLDVRSPSRRTGYTGRMAGVGFVNEFEDSLAGIGGVIDRLASNLTDQLSGMRLSPIALTGAVTPLRVSDGMLSGGGGTINNYYTIVESGAYRQEFNHTIDTKSARDMVETVDFVNALPSARELVRGSRSGRK